MSCLRALEGGGTGGAERLFLNGNMAVGLKE